MFYNQYSKNALASFQLQQQCSGGGPRQTETHIFFVISFPVNRVQGRSQTRRGK